MPLRHRQRKEDRKARKARMSAIMPDVSRDRVAQAGADIPEEAPERKGRAAARISPEGDLPTQEGTLDEARADVRAYGERPGRHTHNRTIRDTVEVDAPEHEPVGLSPEAFNEMWGDGSEDRWEDNEGLPAEDVEGRAGQATKAQGVPLEWAGGGGWKYRIDPQDGSIMATRPSTGKTTKIPIGSRHYSAIIEEYNREGDLGAVEWPAGRRGGTGGAPEAGGDSIPMAKDLFQQGSRPFWEEGQGGTFTQGSAPSAEAAGEAARGDLPSEAEEGTPMTTGQRVDATEAQAREFLRDLHAWWKARTPGLYGRD